MAYGKRICEKCGAEFDGWHNARYCNHCGLELRRASSLACAHRHYVYKIGIRNCEKCGTPFAVGNVHTTLCQKCRCERDHARETEREARRQARLAARREKAEKKMEKPRACRRCGAEFMPLTANQCYCCEECKHEAAKAQRVRYHAHEMEILKSKRLTRSYDATAVRIRMSRIQDGTRGFCGGFVR